MQPDPPLSLWTVYYNPSDYPGKFVARRFELDKPTHDVVVADTLDNVRAGIRMRATFLLTRLDRNPGDDSVIVETWI